MNIKKQQYRKREGLIARLLRLLGVEPSEKNIFRAQILIVIVGVIIVANTFLFGKDSSDRYGNYKQLKKEHPELFRH